MAKFGKNTLVGVVVSAVLILVLLAIVRAVFPGAILDGFMDAKCANVTCPEGQFCEEGVCRPNMPAYSNNYYDEGVESFEDKKKPDTCN